MTSVDGMGDERFWKIVLQGLKGWLFGLDRIPGIHGSVGACELPSHRIWVFWPERMK